MRAWAILSGEYPPAAGGVGDYTAQLAAGLAAAGDEVHVWAPAPCEGGGAGVVGHPLPDRFHRRGRAVLERELKAMRPAPRLLIQYVPQAFGHKGMNWGFCRWAGRRTPRPWVMYHEVAYPREPGQKARHRLLALVTRRMAVKLRRAAGRSFVSNLAWEEWLQRLAPEARAGAWLPVPSNLPVAAEPARVATARGALAPGGGAVIAHFGGLQGRGDFAGDCLAHLLPRLLSADAGRAALLAGPGGEQMSRNIAGRFPALAPRLHAPGYLTPESLAAYLAAADLVIQPYPDGISGRRSTVMAGLALGRATLSTEGRLSEPLWRSSQAVALAPAAGDGETQAGALLPLAEALLRDPAERTRLGTAGAGLYETHFALRHTVRALRAAAAEEDGG